MLHGIWQTRPSNILIFVYLGSQSVNLFRRYMYGWLNRFQKYINLIILCSFLCWNWRRKHKAYMSSLLLKRSQSIYRKTVRLIHSKRSTNILKNDLVFVLWLRGTMQPPNNLLLTCMYTYDINILVVMIYIYRQSPDHFNNMLRGRNLTQWSSST